MIGRAFAAGRPAAPLPRRGTDAGAAPLDRIRWKQIGTFRVARTRIFVIAFYQGNSLRLDRQDGGTNSREPSRRADSAETTSPGGFCAECHDDNSCAYAFAASDWAYAMFDRGGFEYR
jgi:hypothetical protein